MSNDELRAHAEQILRAAVAAADPAQAVRRALLADEGSGRELSALLKERERVILLAVGKAAEAMAGAAVACLGTRIVCGSVTMPGMQRSEAHGTGALPERISAWHAGHPIPDIGSLAAASEALGLARQARGDEIVLCLLSGGASAMWAAPAPGLTLDHLRGASDALLRCGAPIEAVNTVRKHLSGIAGGLLTRAADPAAVVTLAISDVIGAGPDAIGSGPTLPDPTTYADALQVVRDFAVDLPTAALRHLRAGAAGAVPETPKPDELSNVVEPRIVLSVEDALTAAEREGRQLGYEVRVVTAALQGEASKVGSRLAAEVRRTRAEAGRPVALLWGGETTVTVRGGGRGGRNQELALAAAAALDGEEGVVIASMGTDGRDGPTDAAGGMVDGGTVRRGASAGLDVAAHLQANDSYPYLAATGDLILTGQTGTNVNDVTVALVIPSRAVGSE